MSAFARLLRARGHRVSGCDQKLSPQTEALEAEGIPVAQGQSAAHVTQFGSVDVLIASEAVPKDHPELVAAREAGIAVRPRMALLGELLAGGPSVGVIGTHGKTTTTSMIAVALLGAGLDPSAFVGGNVAEFGGGNARFGSGPFVAEVDESDRNFGTLTCQTAVFTNAEDDHVGGNQATYWDTVEEQHAAFAQFVRQAERVLYCLDWADPPKPGTKQTPLAGLCAGAKQTLTYGQRDGADYRAANVQPDPTGTSFDVLYRGERLGSARVQLPGEHNVLNALAALAVVHLYGGGFEQAAAALAQFVGPGRRWERVGELNGALLIDDYAHNATKVAAAISAGHQTGRRVRAIFQPHRYLRTQESWPQLAEALMQADEVLVLDIAAASEAPIEGVHATLISDRMTELGHPAVRYLPDREEVKAELRRTATVSDLILTVGAGDVNQIVHELAAEERAKLGAGV